MPRSIVPFAGALALGPTFPLVICVPVPTGVALPFPLSSNRFTVPLHGHPLPGPGTASPESGQHSGHQRHPTRSHRPRSHWVQVGGAAVDLHSDGRVTLAFAREDIARGRLGETEYRRRYGRQNALARYRRAVDDRGERSGGRGTDLDGAIATRWRSCWH